MDVFFLLLVAAVEGVDNRTKHRCLATDRHRSSVRFFKLCPCLQGIPKHGRLFFFLPAPPLARPRRPPHAPGAHRRARVRACPGARRHAQEGRPRARRRRRRARVRAAQGPGAVGLRQARRHRHGHDRRQQPEPSVSVSVRKRRRGERREEREKERRRERR